MPKLIAYPRMRLAKMVLPLGEQSDGPIKPCAWSWLPPSEENILTVRIPVALIQELLERKRKRGAAPMPVPASPPPVFLHWPLGPPPMKVRLPLARVVVAIKGKSGKKKSGSNTA